MKRNFWMEASNMSRELSPLPNLPPEIITDILLRLPVRSRLKFKCVCKSWLISISSSQFIKSHLDISTKSNNNSVILISAAFSNPLSICSVSSLLCNTVMDNSRAFDFPVSVSGSELRFLGSCHGLLCLSIYSETLVLYNPSIKKLKTLPVCGFDTETALYLRGGLCYDDISDDYKVVKLNTVRNQESMYSTEVSVYSLRSDSWRKIENNHDGRIKSYGVQSVGGILHWVMCSNDMAYLIFAVNTVTNMYDTLEPPKDIGKYGVTKWHMGKLNESLAVFCDYYTTRLDIWAMKEYGVKDSWSKVVSIAYPANPRFHLWPLFVLENADFCLHYGPYMMIYNLRNNSFTTHQIHGIGGRCSVAALPYIESLVAPSFLEE